MCTCVLNLFACGQTSTAEIAGSLLQHLVVNIPKNGNKFVCMSTYELMDHSFHETVKITYQGLPSSYSF